MRQTVCRSAVVVAVIALIGLAAKPAQAQFFIDATFDSTITSDPNHVAIEGVINNAISFYESTFKDPIHVAINFAKGGGLGSSSTYFATGSYQPVINALIADKKSADDATAIAHLPSGPTNPVNGTATINVKTANLRALGFSVSPPVGQPDGFITLNTLLTDVGSPGTTGQYSLLAVTEHEIDEVLGLGSALPVAPSGAPFPEDLFRYNGAGARTFTTSSSALAYFSIDGTTLLAQFDNQNDGGDFGDWQSNPLPGGVGPKVQDAFATPLSHPFLSLTSPEIRALDVIGYDLRGAQNVPVPSSFLTFGLGSVLGGLFIRRRRSSAR